MTTEMLTENGDVLIVGGGPTGLALAGALLALGIVATLIEANAGTTPYTKATNLMQGTQEQLAVYGVMSAMQGKAGAMRNYMMYAYGINLSPRGMHLRESPYSDVLLLGQNRIERVLVDWLEQLRQKIISSTTRKPDAGCRRCGGGHLYARTRDATPLSLRSRI